MKNQIFRFLKQEIKCETIIYCKADKCYTTLYLNNNERIILSKNLKQIEQVLPKQYFFRCHHSFLVNNKYIRNLDYINKKVDINGELIPISSRKFATFINWYLSRHFQK